MIFTLIKLVERILNQNLHYFYIKKGNEIFFGNILIGGNLMEELQKTNIENMIYEIRDKQVMLDKDLADLYNCANGTKDINKAVKRNIKRFPEDFYFQLTKEEFEKLRFQFGTANMLRSLPHVFTEEGVAMLSNRACCRSKRYYNESLRKNEKIYF